MKDKLISSAGELLRAAVAQESPLQVVGTINAYSALMAERVGYRALYLSGAGVANASYGMPDLGMTSLDNVLEDIRRITSVTALPLLVDADTGWGGGFNVARTVQQMEKAGAAGLHIEDQAQEKRCGHRPGKKIVPLEEMVDRVKTAVDARRDRHFVIMARTDAFNEGGIDAVIERSARCIEAGADMIFPEALTHVAQYKQVTSALSVPVLANITEFGLTPLLTREELAQAGVALALYPLSAFRAMSAAAYQVYEAIRKDGTQRNVVNIMQTRSELYEVLDYHQYEKALDK